MRSTTAVALTLAFTFASTSAHAALTATAVRETSKIRPGGPAPAPATSIALSCAQNEFCAFQIAVSAGSAAGTVNDISLGDLAGPSGQTLDGSSAAIYREGFLDIVTPSNSAGVTGSWPDPLIPKVDA